MYKYLDTAHRCVFFDRCIPLISIGPNIDVESTDCSYPICNVNGKCALLFLRSDWSMKRSEVSKRSTPGKDGRVVGKIIPDSDISSIAVQRKKGSGHFTDSRDTAEGSRAANPAAATTGECRANFSVCEGDARVRRPRGNE